MGYLVELDTGEYGCVDADESVFPVDITEHDWRTPYPAVQAEPVFEWERGESRVRPDVFWYPQMGDWVCGERAYRTLKECAGQDLHTIARGTLDGEPVFLVQVTTVLDVVDMEASIVERYPSYEVLAFPAFWRHAEEEIAGRLFRVPKAMTMLFCGERVKAALEAAGIKGLRFVPADWSEG
ncbi:DUF1629 domain-containing protein [Streptomyces sp. NPDC006997]|uniref:imm11 family protein n=1 Tax=Streptomyces sp. NPDC006997 TaxID=3155356 RepID=UPI0033D4088D